jgi:hypothetical protein
VAQPSNAWSNLAYIIASLFILYEVMFKKQPKFLLGFAFSVFLIGISSFFYHASATFVG